MLIQNPLKEGEVLCFKFTNGEEIIGKVIAVNSSDVTIQEPMTLMMSAQGPQMVQWPMMRQEKASVPVNRSSIMAIYPAEDGMTNVYRELIGEKVLFVPEKKIIT